MKQIFILFFVLCLIASCNKPTDTKTTQLSPVDSLVDNWIKNWNTHDSIAINNMFEADAVLIDDNIMTSSHNELALKFINPNIKVIQNMRSEKIKEWSTNDRAGYMGLFKLDIVVNDSIINQPEGAWTLNWKKSETGEWKITNAQIHSAIIETLKSK